MKRLAFVGLFLVTVQGWAYQNNPYPPNLPVAPVITMDVNAYQAMVKGQQISPGSIEANTQRDTELRILIEKNVLKNLTLPQEGQGTVDSTSPRMDDEEIR